MGRGTWACLVHVIAQLDVVAGDQGLGSLPRAQDHQHLGQLRVQHGVHVAPAVQQPVRLDEVVLGFRLRTWGNTGAVLSGWSAAGLVWRASKGWRARAGG